MRLKVLGDKGSLFSMTDVSKIGLHYVVCCVSLIYNTLKVSRFVNVTERGNLCIGAHPCFYEEKKTKN